LDWDLQLVTGILEEVYVIRDLCGGGKEYGSMKSLWANGLVLGLFSTYIVLFAADLGARGEKGEKED
jgi:hypothetical protein